MDFETATGGNGNSTLSNVGMGRYYVGGIGNSALFNVRMGWFYAGGNGNSALSSVGMGGIMLEAIAIQHCPLSEWGGIMLIGPVCGV